MAILRERVAWSKPRARRGPDLSPDEQKAVKKALAFLAKRHGSLVKLSAAMGLKPDAVVHAARERGSVTAGVALRAARAAGVPLEDLLAGRWPEAGTCPLCGRKAG
jgi:hypothetical protein